LSFFNNLKIAIDNPVTNDPTGYYSTDLVKEIMDEKESSPRQKKTFQSLGLSENYS
jgi:hypothetical protein